MLLCLPTFKLLVVIELLIYKLKQADWAKKNSFLRLSTSYVFYVTNVN